MTEQRFATRRERFVREFLIDFNATAAAIRAGYSRRTARSQANDLLTRPDIQARIAELTKVQVDKLNITAEKVLQELTAIAFARPKDFMSWDSSSVTLKSSDEFSPSETAAIAGVSYKSTETQHGGSVSVELKFHDKTKALIAILERYLDLDCAIALLDRRGYDAVPKISPTEPKDLPEDAAIALKPPEIDIIQPAQSRGRDRPVY